MYTAKGYVVVNALGFKAIDIMSNFPHGVTSLFYFIGLGIKIFKKYLVLVFFLCTFVHSFLSQDTKYSIYMLYFVYKIFD